MKIRHVTGEDCARLTDVVNEYSSRSNVSAIVPRLFFEHFQQTSFIIEAAGETIALLIGFISQTNKQQAYIHFIGVNPAYRQQGIARQLYTHFFHVVQQQYGCTEVSAITTPINRTSIVFHESLGFTLQKIEDYNGPGEARIVMSLGLTEENAIMR